VTDLLTTIDASQVNFDIVSRLLTYFIVCVVCVFVYLFIACVNSCILYAQPDSGCGHRSIKYSLDT